MLMLRKTKPSLLYRLISSKESYDTECYYKKMNDLIEHDLDQFEFYDELAEKENEYTDARDSDDINPLLEYIKDQGKKVLPKYQKYFKSE